MIKDITIGQYIAGNSFIHKLDPRTKIGSTVLYMITLFFLGTVVEFLIPFAFLAAIVILSHIGFKFILKGIKPILILILITVVLNIFMIKGDHLLLKYGFISIYYEGVYFAVITTIRLLLLVVCASLLTYTTSPMELTDAIEKSMKPLNRIHVPVHEIAMMMSIALRFIPTLIIETDKIMKAQKSRGAEIDSGNFINRIKSTIPVLIPLFISAFRRADELAVAMESRCYRGGAGRTKMKQLKYHKEDAAAIGFTFAALAVSILIKVVTKG